MTTLSRCETCGSFNTTTVNYGCTPDGPKSCDCAKLREAARLYWMVKGFIPEWLVVSDEKELDSIIYLYTNRMWNNEEAYLHEEGFDEAWEKYNDIHGRDRFEFERDSFARHRWE